MTGLLILTGAIVFYRTTRQFQPGIAFWAIVVVTFIDLFAFGGKFNATPTSPSEYPYILNQGVQQLQRESQTEAFRVNMRNERNMLMGRNQGNLDRIELLEGYTPLGIARYAPFVKPGPHIVDLLNAKYKIDSLGRSLIRNPTYLPRARMVYRYQVASSDSNARDIVKAGQFDYRNSVVLEAGPGFASVETESIANQVTITRREPARMELDVTTAQAGILVLSEVYYPEWKASLDGQPVAIYPADYFLRGITVPAGTHRIEMYYDGRRARTGLLISIVTFVFALGALIGLARRRKDLGRPS
jgi:hypothetical protein